MCSFAKKYTNKSAVRYENFFFQSSLFKSLNVVIIISDMIHNGYEKLGIV